MRRIDPPENIRHLVEGETLTHQEIADRCGVSRNTVLSWCRKLGLRTQRTGPRSGERHTGWKGGVKIVKGYRYLYRPDHPRATKQGYVAEHRLVMEETLGRFLDPHEVVHHRRRGDTLDNRPENLEVFQSNPEHLRHELAGCRPAWTPDGWSRIEAGVQKSATRRRRKAAGDRPRIQTSDHPPS